MQRRSNNVTAYERVLAVLDYLKSNTNKDKKITAAELLNAKDIKEVIKSDDTLNILLKELMRLTNYNDSGGKVLCDNVKHIISENQKYARFGGIYYQPVFSYEEIDAIIESLRFSKSLDTQTANSLIKKIKDNLTDNYYSDSKSGICNVKEADLSDRKLLSENISVINSAILNDGCISFYFNGYNKDKNLQKVHEKKHVVTPFYMVAYNGRYYLIAGKKKYSNLSIWRIDLMTEVKQSVQRESAENYIDKSKCNGVPLEWEDKFVYNHLGMSFDEPTYITLKIIKTSHFKGADYTFLYDCFGDTFKVTEEHDEFDIVKVKCSPFGITKFALQYCDRTEVLEPTYVRDMVVDKIKNLNSKYGPNQLE